MHLQNPISSAPWRRVDPRPNHLESSQHYQFVHWTYLYHSCLARSQSSRNMCSALEQIWLIWCLYAYAGCVPDLWANLGHLELAKSLLQLCSNVILAKLQKPAIRHWRRLDRLAERFTGWRNTSYPCFLGTSTWAIDRPRNLLQYWASSPYTLNLSTSFIAQWLRRLEPFFAHTVLRTSSRSWNFWQLPTADCFSKDIGLSACACRKEAQNPYSPSICWCSLEARQHPLWNSNPCLLTSYSSRSISGTALWGRRALLTPRHAFQVAEASRHDWI